jgi:hypothetical protein
MRCRMLLGVGSSPFLYELDGELQGVLSPNYYYNSRPFLPPSMLQDGDLHAK